MGNMHLFSIAVVFCVNIFIISTKEVSVNGVIRSQTEIKDHIPADTTLNKEFNFNHSELEAARVDAECKCKNGKCIRECDVKKTTPCTDERKVCVCNPEFGKKEEGVCEYCDCGDGFNCTFSKNDYGFTVARCICPKGYYTENYIFDSKCKPECNDERPCQNGGTCTNKRCQCPWHTGGVLCEEIPRCSEMCQNRLEVDCLYHKVYQVPYCDCKNSSLWYDEEADICKPCPCENGYCQYEYGFYHQNLKCNCYYGYKEFNGYCKKCKCDYGFLGKCDLDYKGNQICKCADGFYERDGRCHVCGCNDPDDRYTRCEITGDVKRCFCGAGYKEVDGHCEVFNECENNNPCHPSTTCYDVFGSVYCQCPRGYKGTDGDKVAPGEVCKDIDECQETTVECWFYNNVKCVNLPGSYKCECLRGYEPSSKDDEPETTKCVGTTQNWGPTIIVVCTTLALMAVSRLMHSRVMNRAARSNWS